MELKKIDLAIINIYKYMYIYIYNSIMAYIVKITNIPNIFDSEFNVISSKYQSLPLIKYGFQTYLNSNKMKMDDEKLKNSNFYLVLNNYEHIINDYKNDLKTLSQNYFSKVNKKVNILSRSFYKLWEIIFYFNLIENEKNFNSLHLADNYGPFAQCVMYYRSLYNKSNSKTDKYYVVSSLKKNLVEVYDNGMSGLFKESKDELNDNFGDDGSLSQKSTLDEINKKLSNKFVNLITGNGDVIKNKYKLIEQESYVLILSEIINAIKYQKKNGNFVLRIFDTFTDNTLKYICILKAVYKDVYICKPLTSRKVSEEKFLVCKNFTLSEANRTKYVSKLNKLFLKVISLKKESKFLFNLIEDYEIPNDFINQIKEINKVLSNDQYVNINNVIFYKKSGNYFGDTYHKYKELQIKSTEKWVKHFFPKVSELESTLKKVKV